MVKIARKKMTCKKLRNTTVEIVLLLSYRRQYYIDQTSKSPQLQNQLFELNVYLL